MAATEQPETFGRFAQYRDLRATVMGLGQFGGGVGATRFLCEQGARVTVTDTRSAEELTEAIAQLQAGHVAVAAWHLGGHELADFVETDLLVVSPAVSRAHPLVQQAIGAGVPVTSEMNLFWQHQRGTIIGITGSNGKSTTTAMTHAILEKTGRRCWLGGNIGRSLLPEVAIIEPSDFVVLELSSFQLDDLKELKRSPHVGVVTNFSPNHLDRHGTLEAYRGAKQNLIRWMTKCDWAILNFDDAEVRSWQSPGKTLGFGLEDRDVDGVFLKDEAARVRVGGNEFALPIADWLPIPGAHNLQNALAATCAALCVGAEPDQIEAGLMGFRALPHRLELICETAGRRFFNDSLATTPESAIVALTAFPQPIVLMAGGYDKGVDLAPMAKKIVDSNVKGVSLLGQTGPVLGDHICAADLAGRIKLHVSTDINDAFAWCTAVAKAGDVILLSPGCASYDWFRNFAERGKQFRELAENWKPDA